MELSDIITLVKAGYTKDEIAQMDKQQTADPNPVPVQPAANVPDPNPEPAPAPAPVAEPVAVAQPVPQPAPQPAQAQPQPTMEDLMQSIAKLTSAVQANAIAQSVIPQGLQNPPKAEDMLAEIIRPTYHERK
jgi:hypothetical protein